MSGYRPPQRQIESWILAGSRWIRGTFHVPQLHSFDDHLQKKHPFLLLTGVSLGAGRTIPFLVLRRSFVSMVIPLCPEPLLQIDVMGGTEARPVECWLQEAVVVGEVAVMPKIRISDFMVHRDGFLVIRRAVVTPPPPGIAEFVSCVLVNGREVVAVAEEKGMLEVEELIELEPNAEPA